MTAENALDLICPICGMAFDNEDDLDIHLPDCEAAENERMDEECDDDG